MDDIEKAIIAMKQLFKYNVYGVDNNDVRIAIYALEKQIPKKVCHFLDTDTFETTCCGIDVTNEDFDYCPNCGCLLVGVEEVEE